jgi:hypothetical protein
MRGAHGAAAAMPPSRMKAPRERRGFPAARDCFWLVQRAPARNRSVPQNREITMLKPFLKTTIDHH